MSRYEYEVYSYRRAQLEINYESSEDIDTKLLKEIHYHLFQDVYDWAGKFRRINISKGTNSFSPYKKLDCAMKYIDSKIKLLLENNIKTPEYIYKELAKILLDLNHMHPFREGNGRAQREFIRILADAKGYDLSIKKNNKFYMKACTEDDYKIMYEAIKKDIKKIDEYI